MPSKKKQQKPQSPEVKKAEAQTKALAKTAQGLSKWHKVTVDAMTANRYTEAADVLAHCKDTLAQGDKQRKELVQPLNGVVKKINAIFKAQATPIKDLMDHVGGTLMAGYDEKLRAEEQKRVEKAAKAAERRGEEQYAQDLRDNALRTKALPKVDSVSARDHWTAEVTDLNEVLLAVVENNNPFLQSLRPKLKELLESQLGGLARATKREDLGVKGAKGVRATVFARKAE